MATLRKDIDIDARPEAVWDAARDVGALHTRLVPGFVVDTHLEDNVRVVTFGNGMVVREAIISVDDQRRRLAWTAIGGRTTHYNAVLEIFADGSGAPRGPPILYVEERRWRIRSRRCWRTAWRQ